MMEKIHWLKWSPEVFDRARVDDKLILLDIGAVWCHWCHVMDEECYANPEVVRIVNEHYIAVRVDTDERPDVNDRYNQGGWPTTVILTADGYVVHGATYLPAATLKELLEKAREWYLDNKTRLADAAEEMAREMARKTAVERADHEEPPYFSDAIIEDIRKNADFIHGGFGTTQKFPQPGALSLIFAHYFSTGDKELLEFAEKTLHNMGEGLLDREEGGLFRYSVTPEWNAPHYEKNLDVNAHCLQNYLDACRMTQKAEFAETAEKIIRHVNEVLSDQHRGGFYASQDADIFDSERLKIVMTGEEYYKLSSEERRKHERPFIDTTIYTNSNAFMVSAFLDAHHVLGREDCRDFAVKTLDLLMKQCLHGEFGAYHFLRDGEVGGSGMLTDTIALVRALLDAYETTGSRQRLDDAERLVCIIIDKFLAPDGGFYDTITDERMPPATRITHKSISDNALAIEVLARLYNYTTKNSYLEQAHSAIAAFKENVQALLAHDMGYFASELAVAATFAGDASTKITIVGSLDDSRSHALLREAKRTYRPVKIIQLLDPTRDADLIQAMRYPPADSPVVHVCTEKGCAPPVNEVEQLRALLVAP